MCAVNKNSHFILSFIKEPGIYNILTQCIFYKNALKYQYSVFVKSFVKNFGCVSQISIFIINQRMWGIIFLSYHKVTRRVLSLCVDKQKDIFDGCWLEK